MYIQYAQIVRHVQYVPYVQYVQYVQCVQYVQYAQYVHYVCTYVRMYICTYVRRYLVPSTKDLVCTHLHPLHLSPIRMHPYPSICLTYASEHKYSTHIVVEKMKRSENIQTATL